MDSENSLMKQNQCEYGDGRGKVVDDGYNGYSEESLLNWVDNALKLVTQETEGLSSPGKIHGGSVVAEKEEGQKKEKQLIVEQRQPPRKEKLPIHFFTTHFKHRLRWTPLLHARFVEALNELGGPDKVTPKSLLNAIGIEGLMLHHIKSHLQKYRNGTVTVKEWPPKIFSQLSAGSSIGSFTSNQPFGAFGYKNFKGKGKDHKIKKTFEKPKDGRGQLYLKLQAETCRKLPNGLIQETGEKLVNQHRGRADSNVNGAGMLQQDLAGVATTPSSSSIPETKHSKNSTPDKKRDCISLQRIISSSASLQSQKVDHSATAGFIDSWGHSFPYNSTSAVNVHALLRNEVHASQAQSATDGLQSQNTVYSATNGFFPSNVNYSKNMAYRQDFQPQSVSFSSPQNTSYDYQPQNAYFNFQAQNESYDYYQPQSAANSNQLQDEVFECLPQAAAYGYQPQNAAYSAPNNLPTSKGHFSETAYLNDVNAALAAIGNKSLETINFDPVNAYINWDNLEINSLDNDLSCKVKEHSGHMESPAARK